MGTVCHICENNDHNYDFLEKNVVQSQKENESIIENARAKVKCSDSFNETENIQQRKTTIINNPDEISLDVLKIMSLGAYFKVCVIQNKFKKFIKLKYRKKDENEGTIKSAFKNTKSIKSNKNLNFLIKEKQDNSNLSFSNIALTNNDNLQDNYFQQNTEHNENLEFVKDRVNPMNSAEIFTGNLINNKYYGIGILKLFSNEICYGKCNFLIFY